MSAPLRSKEFADFGSNTFAYETDDEEMPDAFQNEDCHDDWEKVVQDEVHAFNCRDVLSYANSVTLRQGSNSREGQDGNLFELVGPRPEQPKWSSSWCKMLYMRLVSTPSQDRPGQGQRIVEALLEGTWVPLRDVLKDRPIILTGPNLPERDYMKEDHWWLVKTRDWWNKQQREWWYHNGKTFDLLALPAELRLAIYEQLLCAPVYPYQWVLRGGGSRGEKPCWVDSDPTKSTGLLKSEWGPDGTFVRTGEDWLLLTTGKWVLNTYSYEVLNGASSPRDLLLTNKQIHGEVKQVLWKGMNFNFQCDVEKFNKFRRSISAINRGALQRMTIHGPPTLFHDFFRRCGTYLRQFNPAMRLEIHLPHRREYYEWDFGRDWTYKFLCWRALLGGRLWRAKRILAHFDTGKVILTGCIHAGLRTSYLQLLDDIKNWREYQVSEVDIRGQCDEVGFDETACANECEQGCVDDWCICQGIAKLEKDDDKAENM